MLRLRCWQCWCRALPRLSVSGRCDGIAEWRRVPSPVVSCASLRLDEQAKHLLNHQKVLEVIPEMTNRERSNPARPQEGNQA